jgi:uncharacterized RmlC-like cupin family protein/mannose-6-phosphate isomerase-like protein (cupin superfamily)
MNIRATIIATGLAFCMLAGANAQETTRKWDSTWVFGMDNRESAGEEEVERLERVGPTSFRVRPINTPYEHWFTANKHKIPTFEGLVIQDARTYPLGRWEDMGVDGMYIKMADYQITDGWILEIPPKGSIKPQRHMFEAGMYFFGGPGHIILQQEGRRPERIDFGHRSLYSVPLNVRYQIFNDSNEPVRIVAVTNFPFMLNAVNSTEFVFENEFTFTDRYDAEEDYATKVELPRKNLAITNFVKDALNFELDEYDHRGKGTTNIHWTMSGNSVIDAHVSEMPGGLYKKAHRHSSDAFILLLSGEGYSLTWPEGRYEDRVRVDWQEGTIFVPPIYWYHQHLNPHPTESARYLAINAPPVVINLGLRFNDQLEVDLPEIVQEWEEELQKAKTR